MSVAWTTGFCGAPGWFKYATQESTGKQFTFDLLCSGDQRFRGNQSPSLPGAFSLQHSRVNAQLCELIHTKVLMVNMLTVQGTFPLDLTVCVDDAGTQAGDGERHSLLKLFDPLNKGALPSCWVSPSCP